MALLSATRCFLSGALASGRTGRAATLLLTLLLLSMAETVEAYGGTNPDGTKKKSKFMAVYPSIFKFVLFWWCIIVFSIMSAYIIDNLLFRKFGAAKVQWSVEHVFKAAKGGRETFWAQLADPSIWAPSHPILLSADIKMAKCGEEAAKLIAAAEAAKEKDESEAMPDTSLWTMDGLKPLAEGIGIIMRHKENFEPNSGGFFCTRECVQLTKPKAEAWEVAFKTIEIGSGYPYAAGAETTMIELHPEAEDGSLRCVMSGSAEVKSRIHRWWTALEAQAKVGAVGMMEAIEQEVHANKKKD